MTEVLRPRPPKVKSPVPKLDPMRDMTEMLVGELNGRHVGLHARVIDHNESKRYGRITSISHQLHSSLVELTWNGIPDKVRCDPELAIRIEEYL